MSKVLRILTFIGFLSVTVLGFSSAFSSAHAVALFNRVTGCLASSQQNTFPGNPLVTNGCGETFGEEWNWESFGITGIGTNASQARCVDVKGGGTADGTPVQLFPCNGTGAQQWFYFNKQIRNPQSSKCLDSNGIFFTQPTIRTCNGSPAQQWSIR